MITMIKIKHILPIISTISVVIALIITPIYILNDFTTSIIILIQYILIFFSLWYIANCRLEPLILFYSTFGLFILGRFVACALGYNLNLWEPTFYFDYFITTSRKIDIIRFVLSFIGALNIGYYISRRYCLKSTPQVRINVQLLNNILNKVFWILIVSSIFSNIIIFFNVIQNGYLSLYVGNQTSEYTGGNIIGSLSYILFGLAYGYGDKIAQKKYLILFCINALFAIIMGSRSAFGGLLLVLLWMYSQNHKISFIKILFLAISLLIVLLIIFSFSIRAVNAGNTNVTMEILLAFVYDQGISLMVFDASTLVTEYPTIPYFQAFIPGTSFFYRMLSGATIYPWDISFPSYMCNFLNPTYFEKGWGLGWTAMSDFYIFSGRHISLFFILSAFFSYIIGRLELDSRKSRFIKSLIYTIIFPLLLYPRSGLNTIIPLSIYYLIITLLLSTISHFFNKNNIIVKGKVS